MTHKIYIIGAGQLGSRHLQALKSVTADLNITVVDPSNASLATARERYEGIPGTNHPIEFLNQIPENSGPIDIAIIASNSNVRRSIVESLFSRTKVKYLILEKLLFDKKEDFEIVSKILSKTETKTFVNCTMRMVPIYAESLKYFKNQKINFSFTGSQYGLVTNSIHYIDYIAFITQLADYKLNTNLLKLPLIESKRAGFKEINGTLGVEFLNGSSGTIVCFDEGSLPIQIEVTSAKARFISKESEGKAWISTAENNWKWEEVEAKIPYQSQLTAILVNDLISKGTCQLVSFEESAKIHLTLLEGLNEFLTTNKLNFDKFPFT